MHEIPNTVPTEALSNGIASHTIYYPRPRKEIVGFPRVFSLQSRRGRLIKLSHAHTTTHGDDITQSNQSNVGV